MSGIIVEIAASSSDTPFESLAGQVYGPFVDEEFDFTGWSLDEMEAWLRATYPEYDEACRQHERD